MGTAGFDNERYLRTTSSFGASRDSHKLLLDWGKLLFDYHGNALPAMIQCEVRLLSAKEKSRFFCALRGDIERKKTADSGSPTIPSDEADRRSGSGA